MKKYKFYTYDLRGNDIVISIEAFSIDDAWQRFKKTHPNCPVRLYQIIRKSGRAV